MIPNSKNFNGKTVCECEGKTYYRWYPIQKHGDFQLKFRIVRTSSPYKQGLALFFSDFKGLVFLNGKNLPILKGKFKHYTVVQDQIKENELTVSVHAECGSLVIGNASEIPGANYLECGAFGCAFWIENLNDSTCRFHCNDHEYDDDFDDFIFELEIRSIEKA